MVLQIKKVVPWLLTESGKKFSMMCAGTASIAAMSAHYLPHTLLLDYYKDFVKLFNHGIPVPLPMKLQERFQKTLDLVGVEEPEKPLYKAFHAYGFDIRSYGMADSRYGVYIGLPFNFAYDTVRDIEKSKIKMSEESIDWDSEEGQQLQDSLVLSENAQLYAMAREVKFRQTWKVYFDTFFASSSCLSVYGASTWMNEKFGLYSRPRSIRMVSYGLITTLMLSFYLLMKDVSQFTLEKRIDEKLKNANPIFAEGGKEYYTKIIERNKALRKLLGKQGEFQYTALGNDNHYLRVKHIPLVQRKEFFEGVPIA